eukprot:scaffold78481_cov54-Phaeocystis_antarctica.AAC.2
MADIMFNEVFALWCSTWVGLGDLVRVRVRGRVLVMPSRLQPAFEAGCTCEYVHQVRGPRRRWWPGPRERHAGLAAQRVRCLAPHHG